MSRRDRSFLDLALKIAETSDCNSKHGAVIVKGGRVMSVGVNKFRNDPAFVPSDVKNGRGTIFSIHAEEFALSRAGDVKGAVMYIARLSKRGPAFSRPCNHCAKKLIKAGIKTVVYTQ